MLGTNFFSLEKESDRLEWLSEYIMREVSIFDADYEDDELDQLDKLSAEIERIKKEIDRLERQIEEYETERGKLILSVSHKYQEGSEEYLRYSWYIYWKYDRAFSRSAISKMPPIIIKYTKRCAVCGYVEQRELSITSKTKLKSVASREFAELIRDKVNCQCRQNEVLLRAAEAEKEQEKRQHRLQELRTMPYSEYLQTPEWKETRKKALKRAGFKCQLCNSAESLNVHHRTYERRGEEAYQDLIVLCKTCHSKHHDKLEN